MVVFIFRLGATLRHLERKKKTSDGILNGITAVDFGVSEYILVHLLQIVAETETFLLKIVFLIYNNKINIIFLQYFSDIQGGLEVMAKIRY